MSQSNQNHSSTNFNKGKSNGIFERTLGILTFAKKIMARPDHNSDVDTWRLVDTCARFCGGSFHLHSVLRRTVCIY